MPVLTWRGADDWRAEQATVRSADGGFAARGVQLGVLPLPYPVDYRLDTGPAWRTRTLDVAASGEGWERSIHLARAADGGWTCEATATGAVDLPGPGGDTGPFAAAEDCDLGLSPLTNTMPI